MKIRPDRAEFHRLASDYTVVPVWTELLADLETPVAAFAKLVGDGPGFVLESVEHAERWSRFSFVGRRPTATLVARDGRIEVTGELAAGVPRDGGVLRAVEGVLAAYRSPPTPELPPLHGGLVGYLGYDVVREVEHLPCVPRDDLGHPDAVLSVIGSLAAFDHWRQRVSLIESVPVGLSTSSAELDLAYDAAIERIHEAARDLGSPLAYTPVPPPDPSEPLPVVTSPMGHDSYQRAVEVAKEHILAGDIFQVVLAQRFDLDLRADPFDVYRVLRQVNPSPYMYFVRHPEVTIVGSSPEPMVQLLGGRVISRPIAGTRRRGETDDDDRRLGAELREHPKEIAEHVMLVDLARNDVGRVVRFGTEQVDEMMVLERYSHVMHLTSQVSGELRDGLGPVDVLRATLPAGTVSGAPKVRAMEIIDGLEPSKRCGYAGVIGYLDFSGNLDTAIAIRTMFIGPNGASVQAGAGIVADSDPAAEDEECWNKAKALLAAVPAARRMSQRAMADLFWVEIPRDFVRVAGPDAATFLQGQISQDTEIVRARGSAWSFLLQPQGKVDAWLRVAAGSDDEYVLDVDGGFGEAVVARLNRFKLRVKVDVDRLEWMCVATRGDGASGQPGLAAEWPGVEGVDSVGQVVGGLGRRGTLDDYERARIGAGVPAMGREITTSTIPGELGVNDRSVSFTKGCYTGQELVARVDSRGGNVPRHLRLVRVDGDAPAGAAVVHTGREVGSLTSVATDGGGTLALALLARSVEPPADVVVRVGDTELVAHATELPR